MAAWSLYGKASRLHTNTHKSSLSSCNVEWSWSSESCWEGMVFPRGITRHLGYPIGVDVSRVELSEWISRSIHDKFVYSKYQAWPIHVRLIVAWVIMTGMVSFLLPLLIWPKKILPHLMRPLGFMLWKSKATYEAKCGCLGIMHYTQTNGCNIYILYPLASYCLPLVFIARHVCTTKSAMGTDGHRPHCTSGHLIREHSYWGIMGGPQE